MRRLKTILLSTMFTIAGIAVSTPAGAQGLFSNPQLGILGGVTLPTGDLGEGASIGWNAGAFFKVRITGPLDIRVDGGYTKLGAERFDLEGGTTFDLDGDIAFGTLGALVNLGPDSASYPGDNSISPYIMGGLGVYRFKFDGTCSGSLCPDLVDDFETSEFGFNVGAGANVPLWGIPAIAEFRYHRFSTMLPVAGGREGTATMLTGSVGIKFK